MKLTYVGLSQEAKSIIIFILGKTYGLFSLMNGALCYAMSPSFKIKIKKEKLIIQLICMLALGLLLYSVVSLSLFFIYAKGPIIISKENPDLNKFTFFEFQDYNFLAIGFISIIFTFLCCLIDIYCDYKNGKSKLKRKAFDKF